MSPEDDKSRENWHRITLRIPPDLHQRLLDSAGNLSLNAWLIMLLDDAMVSSSFVKKSQSVVDRLDKLREQKQQAGQQVAPPAGIDELLKSIRSVVQFTVREEIEKVLEKRATKRDR